VDKLIFGCGYLGIQVARRWRDAGDRVFAVTRSSERGRQFRAEGLFPIVADVTQPETLSELPQASSVLFAVGFDRTTGASVREVYVAGLRSALAAVSPSTRRFLYVSSTGVFGQTDGTWVDEDSPCEPTRPTGRACLDAESLLQEHELGPRSIILRLAGIYGPGRVPRRAQLMRGEPLVVAENGRLNLIHVDDAATVILAAEAQASVPNLYLVSDGYPVLRRQYCQHVARLVQAPNVRFQEPPPNSPKAQRGATDKRVSNTKMMRELTVKLRYPSYREGLAAIVEGS
jgi:nucleoside-diphosphate-sugar epimerase